MAAPVSTQILPIPQLQGLVPQKVDEHLRQSAQAVNALSQKLAMVASPNLSGYLTKAQAKELYSSGAIVKEIQVNGISPLNLTGLIGVTAQPQNTAVPVVTSLPTSGPLLQNGVLVSYQGILYRFTASPAPGTWSVQETLAILLTGTHTTRITTPPAAYQVGTLFYELDRTTTYIARTTSGVVSTAGTTVTWVSGDLFAAVTMGSSITINGVVYSIMTFTSTTSLVLTATAGTQVKVAYSTPTIQWLWYSGVFNTTVGSFPTDLTANDTGFLAYEQATYFHMVTWTGTGWKRGAGDTEHADSFHEFGGAPTDGGWHSCDGSTQAFFVYTTPNTVGSRVLPNLASTPAYAKGGSTYSPTITAATLPTVTTTVPPASAPTVGTGSVLNGTGSPTTVIVSVTGGGGGGGVNIPGTVVLPNDPIANFPVVKYYRQ